MAFGIHLLGRPRVVDPGREVYRVRSQKSWALLALLYLRRQPLSRSEIAALLFPDADDPLGALRWNLAEIRRVLGGEAVVSGDPVRLVLSAAATVDVDQLTHGTWRTALEIPDLGAELLEGIAPQGSHSFDRWLAAERRRLATASQAVLHEAALGLLAEGETQRALEFATRAVDVDPLEENLQALRIRVLREAGDVAGAKAAYEECRRLLRDELGVDPGLAVESAWRTESTGPPDSPATVVVLLESGQAAIAAGALPAGMTSLRVAVGHSDRSSSVDLQIRTRIALAEALIHSVRGLDEEGIAALHRAAAIARTSDAATAIAEINAELGYVDFLRARYDRAARWLSEALEMAGDNVSTRARALMYLGSVHSDRGDYGRALRDLGEATELSENAGLVRQAAYSLSMLGRVRLLRGELTLAAEALLHSTHLCEVDHWLSFLPWPQALYGEVLLAQGDVPGATLALEHAFARACQVGDPCWEGISVRGLALVADAQGDSESAFELLDDARSRSTRVADAYVWLDAYILDARCVLGIRHGHQRTESWIRALSALAERTDMREMRVRALAYGATMGHQGDAESARDLALAVDNPALADLVALHVAG